MYDRIGLVSVMRGSILTTKPTVICQDQLKQLYVLSFQDVGTLYGGEEE